jgi:23S rRNA pseudouridine955/2504/2580 synthase
MTGVVTLEVTVEDAGIRLDRWFLRHFPNLSHGRLEKLLRTGQVRVDGGRAKASVRLTAGSRVRVPPLPAAEPGAAAVPPPAPTAEDAAFVQSLVIHRDDRVIAINKPPGLAVQGGTGLTRHLDAMLDALRFDAESRPRLVHRLDRDTSGVLLLARSASAAAALGEAFRARETRKIYWAIVVGSPPANEGCIDLAIAKGHDGDIEKMRPDKEGKRAITYYSVLERAGRRAAFVALRPITGRTHQLRAHCAALGIPILGDGKYGGTAAFIPGIDADFLHLHARSIALTAPRKLRVVAPLPPEMRRTWDFFGFDPEDRRDPLADLDL